MVFGTRFLVKDVLINLFIFLVCSVGVFSICRITHYTVLKYYFDSREKVENPKHILVYIDSRPPLEMESKVWHNVVMLALSEWFSPAGCAVTVTDDINVAQIRFSVKPLEGMWGQMICLNPFTEFPYLPIPEDNTRIEIEEEILIARGGNIRRTLLHEIGHAIGIKHRQNSIVTDKLPKPSRLTPLDKQSIQEFKKFIENY